MIQNDWSILVRQSREHVHHGHFDKAMSILRERLNVERSIAEKAQLASEITDIQQLQGHFTQAYIVASDALLWEIPRSLNIKGLLVIQKALMGVMAFGSYGDAIQHVEYVFEHMLKDLRLEEYTSILVHMEAYRARFLGVASLDRKYDLKVTAEATDRLQPLLQHLIKENAIEDAWCIASRLSWSPESQEFGLESVINDLLQSVDLPDYRRPSIHYEYARYLQAKGRTEQSRESFTAARDAFVLMEHPYGGFKVQLSLLLEPDNAQTDWRTLHQLLGEFKAVAPQMDYYNSLEAAQMLADRASKTEDLSLFLQELRACGVVNESRFFWADQQIHEALIWYRSGKQGSAINLLSTLLSSVQSWNVPYRQGLIAQILSRAYKSIKNLEQARHWAVECVRHWKDCRISDIQSATEELAELDRIITPPTLEDEVRANKAAISADIAEQLWMNSINKSVALARRILGATHLQVSERVIDAKLILELALQLLCKLPKKDQLVPYTNIVDTICTGLKKVAERGSDLKLYDQAIALQSSLRIDHLEQKSVFHAAVAGLSVALLHHDIFRHCANTESDSQVNALQQALTQLEEIKPEFMRLQHRSMIAFTSFWIAYIQFLLWARNQVTFSDLHRSLSEAQQAADEKRGDLSALQTLEAVQSKQTMASAQEVKRIHQLGFWACVQENELEQAWLWIQNGKARSISDILGLGPVIPEKVLRDVRDDQNALQFLEKEKELVKRQDAGSSKNRAEVHAEIQELRMKMRENKSLENLLAIRSGAPLNLEKMRHLKDALPPGSFLVDWVAGVDGTLHMCVLCHTGSLMWYRLDITFKNVKDWLESRFNTDKRREETLKCRGTTPLEELSPLIAPLAQASAAGNILIFSPTAILHELPLHALSLPGENIPIILRNPIVYCASLSIFYKCLTAAHTSEYEISRVAKPAIFAVYEDSSLGSAKPGAKESFVEEMKLFQRENGDVIRKSVVNDQSQEGDEFQTATQNSCSKEIDQLRERESQYAERYAFYVERDAIHKTADKLANILGTIPLKSGDVTKESLSESLQTARILHFHGHCEFEANNVLEQALILSAESNDHESSHTGKMTVRDIFSIGLRGGLVSLIACDSASQKMSEGDEPLGMVTALLCSGATSVLGTLWPAWSPAGRKFSKAFFTKLQESAQAEDWCNLALASQSAVRDVMGRREFKEPYYWAPFVLHGSFLLKSER